METGASQELTDLSTLTVLPRSQAVPVSQKMKLRVTPKVVLWPPYACAHTRHMYHAHMIEKDKVGYLLSVLHGWEVLEFC